MRYPINGTITVTSPFGEYGSVWTFGRHMGVDLRANFIALYAPASGVITERYVGSKGIQVLAMRIGNYDHRFLHLSAMTVNVGDRVNAGQRIGTTGNSGGVAAHIHWDVRKAGTAWNRSFSDYINPSTLITSTPVQGDSMTLSTEAVKSIYRYLLKREGDAGGVKNYTGKTLNFTLNDITKSAEFRAVNTVNNTITVEKPVTVIKEVVKEVIKEVPVEVIKEKEVIIEKPVPLSDLSMGQLFEALVKKITGR